MNDPSSSKTEKREGRENMTKKSKGDRGQALKAQRGVDRGQRVN